MIIFKSISVQERELIQRFTLNNRLCSCDYSFSNIFSWSFRFGTQYAIVDGFLVLRFYYGDCPAYMIPVPGPQFGFRSIGLQCLCAGEESLTDGDANGVEMALVEVIRKLMLQCSSIGCPFRMLGLTQRIKGLMEMVFPDMFVYQVNRDSADYIYNRITLETLAGKKLQSKRNHINKFKALYPDYRYCHIGGETVGKCIDTIQRWRKISKGEYDYDESLAMEMRSMMTIFENWDELGMIGGAIFVGETMVAFSYGAPISADTFDVCVEKADISYDGAFTIINQEFVKHLPEQYIYINREEDLGVQGLRKAKLSYMPLAVLDKISIEEKNPVRNSMDMERVKGEVRELWRRVFEDPERFIDLYFTEVYKDEYNYFCHLDGKVVSALQMLPFTVKYHGLKAESVYVSGVATLPEYRGRGIAGTLLRKAHYSVFCQGAVFAQLIPAGEGLFKWYEGKGYSCVARCVPPAADPRLTNFQEYDALQQERECTILLESHWYDVVRKDFDLAGHQAHLPEGERPAMVRIINVGKALEIYSKAHPEHRACYRVYGDEDIHQNNAWFFIGAGEVKRSDEPVSQAVSISIGELSCMIFSSSPLTMSLMLDE